VENRSFGTLENIGLKCSGTTQNLGTVARLRAGQFDATLSNTAVTASSAPLLQSVETSMHSLEQCSDGPKNRVV
jgi:hypothetical protein